MQVPFFVLLSVLAVAYLSVRPGAVNVVSSILLVFGVLIMVTILLMMDNFDGIRDDIFSSSVNFEFSIHLVSFCPLAFPDIEEKLRTKYRKLYIKDQ